MRKLLLSVLFLPFLAQADLVTWTDWTRIDYYNATGVMGNIDVTVTAVSGLINGPSQTSCVNGTNWWTEPTSSNPNYNGPAYTGGSIDNAPTPCEQVALNDQVTVSVSFSEQVDTLYMALLSVGAPSSYWTVAYDFDAAFTVDSDGWGYWNERTGSAGTYTLGVGDTISMNEFHGVLAFNDPITSLTFETSRNEYWHAFTFGMATSVPEPGTLALLGLGLLGMGIARRRKA